MKVKILVAALILTQLVVAQAPGSNKSQILFQTDGPPPVTSITTQVTGSGTQTFYYWVVANYPIGSSFAGGPSLARNAPDTFSGSNFVTITWQGLTGVTTYDVLRTATTSFPNGQCTCAVATGLTVTNFVNNTNTINLYTINTAATANGLMRLDNENFAVPTYVFFPPISSSSIIGPAGGGLTGNYPNPLLAGIFTPGLIPHASALGTLADSADLSYGTVTGTGASIAGPGVVIQSPATGAFRLLSGTGAWGITISADDRVDQPVATQPWLRVGGVGHSDLILNAGDTTNFIRLINDKGIGTIYGGYLESVGTTFAALGAPASGTIIYCTDCTTTNPCAGLGTGAFATRINGAWSCSAGGPAGAGGAVNSIQFNNAGSFGGITPVRGDTLYADTVPSWQKLAGNITTTQKFLSQTGDGANAGPTSWQVLPSQGVLTYYHTNTASSPVLATYLKQTVTPFSPITNIDYGPLAAGTFTHQNWTTDPGIPNLTFIPAGTYSCHLHALQTVGTRNSQFFCEFWEVSATDVDVALIGTSELSTVLTGAETEYNLFFVDGNTYTLGSTASRIVTRLRSVEAAAGSNATIRVRVGGTADAHTSLPSATVDASNFVPYIGATQDLNLGTHFYSGAPGGNIATWAKYSLVKIANGVNGCANANGCWQTNGILGANAAAGLSQDVVLFQLPANGAISQWRIKPNTACTGSTTAVTGLGTAGNDVFYRLATMDIQAAASATNFDGNVSAGGSTTTSAVNIVASLVNTINNIDQLVTGCAVDYWVRWAVLP